MLERLKPEQKGLDFGCGPGPALSEMMKEAGYDMEVYDPFYFNNPVVLDKKYDFITSTEVVEHLQNPGEVFSGLFNMLKPGSYLGLMTKLVLNFEAFKNWHYIHDLTHICFYSPETFHHLADIYSAELEFIRNDVIILRKN
jgi:2-polyprenyl-3-methyl-5-hydroxy-6-metoxy-1,4-benzoquinol methylase